MNLSERRHLAGSPLALPVLGLGCSQLGGLHQEMPAQQAVDTLANAWQQGIRYFDTAPFYGHGRSEHRLGTVLDEQERDEFVLSSKVGRLLAPNGSERANDDGWARPLPFKPVYDYSYDAILRSHEDSLQRLGLSRIDILYVHDIGRRTHGERHDLHWQALTQGGGFRALEQLRSSGQVRAIGLGVNEWEIVVDSMGECQLDCTLLAGRYTLLEQQSLRPLLDRCVAGGNAIVAGGVFNSGILAGGQHFDYGVAPAAVVAKVGALQEVCTEFAIPLAAAALQFPLAHPAVVSCVIGARSAEQVSTNVAWLQTPIPVAFWNTLKQRGLLDDAAPVPGKPA